MAELDWPAIMRALADPFDPEHVSFRPQSPGKGKRLEQGTSCQAVCYIDAREAMDLLDRVVPGLWAFDWAPIVIEQGEVVHAKGILTIAGIGRADVGDGSNFATTKGAISDAFKRAAVQWGIGRYLYDMPMAWVTLGPGGRISPQEEKKLRNQLPRPGQPAAVIYRDEVDRPAEAGSGEGGRAPQRQGQQPAAGTQAPPPPNPNKKRSWTSLSARAHAAKIYETQEQWAAFVRRNIGGEGTVLAPNDPGQYDAVERAIADREADNLTADLDPSFAGRTPTAAPATRH